MGKAWSVPGLDPDKKLSVCLRAILLTRSKEMFSHQPRVMMDDNTDAVHDMRVAARRLQTMLTIFQSCFPKKQFKRQYRTLRELIRSFGAVREDDILIAMLNDYAQRRPDVTDRSVNLLIARRLMLRQRANQGLQHNLLRLKRKKFQKDLEAFIDDSF
jgi:CHAD domain-containing protein